MKHFLYALLALGLCSCASNNFQIEGHTSSPQLDGKMVYVKAINGLDMVAVDSCEVIHGNFSMTGPCDTVRMAELFMDDMQVMPLVLEPAALTVCLDDTLMRVSGTELNDQLYEFLKQKNSLEMEFQELPRRESQMYLAGKDEYEINQVLSGEANRLTRAYDQLVMKYLTENFDNILSVGVFIIHTNNGQPPMMNAQIDDIMSKASESFKANAYVQEFIKAAEANMRNIGQ